MHENSMDELEGRIIQVKRIALATAASLGSANAVLMAMYNSDPVIIISNMIIALILLGSMVSMKMYPLSTKPHIVIVYMAAMYFFLLFCMGVGNGYAAMWSLIIPMFTFYIRGFREGLYIAVVYFILSLCCIGAAYVLPGILYPYSFDFVIRYTLIYILILMVSAAYQYSNNKLQVLLEEKARIAKNASDAKGRFLANMSHEIRTPLNGVIGFTELLLRTPLNNTQKKYVEYANISGNSLLDVINDILDFSKIESGKLEIEKIQTNVVEILEETADIMKYHTRKKGLELLLDIPADIEQYAEFDPLRLKQIIINLLYNAVKFTETGEVELKLEFSPAKEGVGKYRFSVRDTGIGVDEEEKENIFRAFSQEDDSFTRKFGGTGLGLYISNMLAEKMGSTIHITSTPGRGTTFYFTIETPYTSSGHMGPASLRPILRTVLIIDDNASAGRIMKKRIRHWGIGCTCCEDLVSACAVLEIHSFDLLIADYSMLTVDDPACMDLIRRKNHFHGDTLPVILMLESFDDYDRMSHCTLSGVVSTIEKPVKTGDLYQKICTVNTAATDNFTRVSETPGNSLTDESGRLSKKVLIVEDNELNMNLLSTIIQKQYPEVELFYAENGIEAVNAVKENNVDLILMDIHMPLMDGFEAAEKIRQWETGREGALSIPILALTAGATEEEKQKSVDHKMDYFITKPIRAEQLHSILETYLQNT
ncbi:MAG: response regulator [Fibrobacterota bacterium]